jgi:hypothetical protein
MSDLRWNPTKSLRLKQVRGVSFEDIIKAELVEVQENPTRREQIYLLFWHKRLYMGCSGGRGVRLYISQNLISESEIYKNI